MNHGNSFIIQNCFLTCVAMGFYLVRLGSNWERKDPTQAEDIRTLENSI